ncbi:hypothetical protein [Humisphaera borealis]|uniref:Uncharacterized protein n=1 Tax=Humisphaera borealis TaxID=2807512 RepID=A0A7M2WZP2_9BACT|nr:hypothetical protein [Humisphaera borealis]QOV90909.1 hypothetical protein IPV69_05990 [Humisphaera borealis]
MTDRKRQRLIRRVRDLWIGCATLRGQLDGTRHRLAAQTALATTVPGLAYLAPTIAEATAEAMSDASELAKIDAWCAQTMEQLGSDVTV